MQHLHPGFMALHLQQLLVIAVALELGDGAAQGFDVRVAAALGEGGGLYQRAPFTVIEEEGAALKCSGSR